MFFNGISPDEDKCCGCTACQQICRHNAISMTLNTDGFILPQVDIEKCVECGLCEKVCPILHSEKVISKKVGKCYGAVNCDNNVLLSSSSGGIFSAIADYVISMNGIVYGAAFDNNMQLRHISIETKEELLKLRGSKYLQSSLESVYRNINELLKKGKLVYFTGTGCQVAGLKCFLMKPFDNLICSDILCHGTPNQFIFNSVISFLEKKYDGKVINYKFRDKKIFGWSCSSSSSIKCKNKIKNINFDPIMISYFNAFISGCMNREVCYKCPFAQEKRTGDITLADFWGVQNYIKIKNRNDGVSAIIVNTHQGKTILEAIKSTVNLYPTKINDIAVINETLHNPTPRPKYRDVFFSDFKSAPNNTLLSFQGNINKRQIVYRIKKICQSNILYKKIYRFLQNLKK